ncbi:DUF317 domain-containing protein [Streptomyces zaomyceticus]|uniref:DUF317 domain-containing protein n=1 Tax=Streptomyces TaxID=1883 RepID=UPI0037181966
MTYIPEGDVYVSPRHLAGADWCGDAGFVPVKHWPTVHLEDGPCQMLITSPDQRIRIGWYGDDFDVYRISASEDASSPTRWSAAFNNEFPAEIVAAFTTALERDWDARKDQEPFIETPPRTGQHEYSRCSTRAGRPSGFRDRQPSGLGAAPAVSTARTSRSRPQTAPREYPSTSAATTSTRRRSCCGPDPPDGTEPKPASPPAHPPT